MKRFPLLALVLAVCSVSGLLGQGRSEEMRPIVSQAVRQDVSPPLRDIPARPPVPGPNRMVRNKTEFFPPGLNRVQLGADPLVDSSQSSSAVTTQTPQPSYSFDGVSDDDNAAKLGFRIVPPDTNGDVGRNHYVQTANLLYEVFEKETGNTVFGPIGADTLWTGFGGICETNNDGDPIVLYDHLADRWMISQFAIGSTGHQCFAVSTSPDPTGSYYRYDFEISTGLNGFNDYPKIGLWADGYYLSANEFGGPTQSFQGAIAVAFERNRMLLGQSAQFVKFGPLPCGAECTFAIQPSHLEGPAPAAGTPNTFVMAFDDDTWGSGTKPDGYRLWNFAVNWTSPASSTLTALSQVDAPEFDAELCGFSRSCISQPSPGERLDSLGQFTMYRAQYRNFGSYQTIVVNHTVDVTGGSQAGVRWAELRNAGGGWSLHQTGTIAPDGNNRWMGSIAMDGDGNIAVGYNVSGSSTFPSLRYATRSAGDALGSMGSEVEMVAGGGVQQSSYSRWGDYSSLSVDPTDDCTFWFAGEYYANSGAFDWATRIGSFKVPSCSVVPCTSDSECNDSDACTADSCEGGVCENSLAVTCGDGWVCDPDSGQCVTCGNGVCDAGETCDSCAVDCEAGTTSGAVCGNGVCEAGNGEDCLSCPSDCNGVQGGKPSSRYCCGDGDGQNAVSCADARCGGDSCTTVPAVPLDYCCGDGTCNGAEALESCNIDCAASCEASEISCSDGLDNDCNFFTDCEDLACTSDPACSSTQCKASNEACTTNSECCSGNCRTSGKKANTCS